MTVNKITSPITPLELINKTNEIIDNLGGGGSGSSYTAGTGIDITNNQISVDFTDVATATQGSKADTAVQPTTLNNYYDKTETDALLETKIPTGSVITPLEYSVTSSSVESINYNSSVFWSSTSNGYSFPSCSDFTNGYRAASFLGNQGVPNQQYNIMYAGDLTDKVISYTQSNLESSFNTETVLIGTLTPEGQFIPRYATVCDYAGYSSGQRGFVACTSTTLKADWDPSGGSNRIATGYTDGISRLATMFTGNNSGVWKIEVKIADNDGYPNFTIKTYSKDGTLIGSTTTSGNPLSLATSQLNCVLFPIRRYNYGYSSDNNNYDLDKFGIFDLQGNQLWAPADVSYIKELKLNIGSGLAVQNGALVNTESLPSQTGVTDAVLTSDGTDASWQELEQVHCVIETYVNGTSWYRVYSDGWCEQGGQGSVSGSGANIAARITFIKQYTQVCTVIATGSPASNFPDTNGTWAVKIADQSNTGATFVRYGSTITSFAWQACGYIA